MPPVIIPAVLAGVAGGFEIWAGSLLVYTGFAWGSFATSLVLGGLAKLIAPKAKAAASSAVPTSGIAQAIKQAVITRQIAYGELRVSGGIVYMGSSSDNKYLHMIVTLAPHEINEIGEVWLDNNSITPDMLDGSGNVISGKYSGYVRIKKHLGSASQAADGDAVNEITGWTTNHQLRGIAYLYLRLQWSNNIFPGGIPNPSAWVRGKSVTDSRDGISRFTANIALFAADYLQSNEYGFSAAASEVDGTFLNASANTGDEFVTTNNVNTVVSSLSASSNIITLAGTTLSYQRGDKINLLTTGVAPGGLATATDYYFIPYQRQTTPRCLLASSYANALAGIAIDITDAGAGTHTLRKVAEPRYAGAILIDTSQAIGGNLTNILSGMGGQAVYSGGEYLIQCAGYQTPTVHFDENAMIGPMIIQTKISQRERFNTVRGTYIDPSFSGQAVDYPEITNSTYVTQDSGFSVIKQIDYPATQRPATCQRLSKIALEKMRQEISFQCDFNLSAFQVQVGDTAYFTFAPMGWTDKIFEVVSWQLNSKADANGVTTPFITMGLRETASGIYDWNNGEQTTTDLAPNTTFPDPFDVPVITGLAINSIKVVTSSGTDSIYKITVQWDTVPDQFVTAGGRIEIAYKKSSDVPWIPTYPVPGNSTTAEVSVAATLNVPYDVRVRAINNAGVEGAYTTLTGFTIGSSGGVGATIDFGNWTDSVGASNGYGNWTDAVGSTNDYGFFT